MPPLFHENRFITDFKEKAELSSSFFSNQCSLLENCSKLPTNLRYVTDKRLRTISFTAVNIEKIIVTLNPKISFKKIFSSSFLLTMIQIKPMIMTTSLYAYVAIPFVNL